MKRDDISSLAHSKWNCKYHVLFAPKYRRMVIYNQIKSDIGKIVRKLCEQKGVEIIEAEACADHIHMLIAIPPKYSVKEQKENRRVHKKSVAGGYCKRSVKPV